MLPVLVAAAFLAGTEVSSLQFYDKNLPNSVMAKNLKIRNGLWRMVAFGMAYVASQNPSAVAMYWMMSGSTAVAMNLIIMSPKFRRLVRIPQLPTEDRNPYQKLVTNFRLRWKNFIAKFWKL
jgi:mitochondrial inner membrane protein COX18